MDPRFEQFIKEPQYLHNVSPAPWSGIGTVSSGSAPPPQPKMI